jgi:hypothetical protein
MNNNSFMVFSGTASRYLAEKICEELGCPLGNLTVTKFADGEFEVCYEESIRGRDVFLVQSTFPNSDNLMELLLMIDAAKRASARSICAVVPYFGWARQDRKSKPRVSIGAKLVPAVSTMSSTNTTSMPSTSPMICMSATSLAFLRLLLQSTMGQSRYLAYEAARFEPPTSGEAMQRFLRFKLLI